MLTPADVRWLRDQLGFERPELLAALVGVTTRTVKRWEAGTHVPLGTGAIVAMILTERIRSDPSSLRALRTLAYNAVRIQTIGFPYFFSRLLDALLTIAQSER